MMNRIIKAVMKDDQGYALISVLMIGLLISSMLLGLISIRYFNFILAEKRVRKKKLDLACYSAVQSHIASVKDILSEGKYVTDIDKFHVSVEYHMKGLFYEVTAESKDRSDSSKVKYLFADELTPPFDNALIISHPELSAAYTGSTRIKGNILAAAGSITKGNIFGIDPSSGKFLDGGKLVTDTKIKEKYFSEEIVKKLFNYKMPGDIKVIKGSARLNFKELDSVKNIFVSGDIFLFGQSSKNAVKAGSRLYVKGKTIIDENSISDKDIEIISDSTVSIRNNSRLQNILVKAKKGITIEEGSQLKNSQMFSGKFIKADNTLFKYPSVLCIYTPSKDTSGKNILELKSSILNGSAMLINDFTGIWGNKSKVLIDEKSTVQGLIYSENNSGIMGKVKGTVYTNNLWYYKAPTEYINWLVNLNIDRAELDNNFLLPIGLGQNGKMKLLKEQWVY